MRPFRGKLLTHCASEPFVQLFFMLVPMVTIPHLLAFLGASFSFARINSLICTGVLFYSLWDLLRSGYFDELDVRQAAFKAHVWPGLFIVCNMLVFGFLYQPATQGIYEAMGRFSGTAICFACMYAVTVGALSISALLVLCEDSNDATTSFCTSLGLAAYALGSLMWNYVGSDIQANSILATIVLPLVTLTLSGFFAFFISWLGTFRPNRGDLNNADALPAESRTMPMTLKAEHASRLTSRESQVVGLCLAGLSSKEAASELGIGPSTVREYLSRAYKKLDIADAGELVALYEGEREETQPRSQVVVESMDSLHKVGIVALLSGLTLWFFPDAWSVEGGEIGFQACCSAAAACLLTGLFAPIVAAFQVNPLHLPALRLLLIAIMMLNGVSINSLWDMGAKAILFIGDAFVLSALFLSALVNIGKGEFSSHLPAYCGVSAVCVFTCHAFSWSVVAVARALLILSIVFIPLGRTVSSDVGFDRKRAKLPLCPRGLMCVALFGFMVGMAFSGGWGGIRDGASILPSMAFLMPVVLVLLDMVSRLNASLRISLWSSAAALFVFAMAQPYFFPIGCLFLFELLTVSFWARAPLPSSALIVVGLSFGLSVLVSDFGMTLMGNWLSESRLLFGVVPAQAETRAAVESSATLLFFLLGIVCAVLLWRNRKEASLGISTDADDEEMRSYFVSQGLTELQINVIESLLAGKGVKTIAKELHYSESAIRQARAACYRLFSVSDVSSLAKSVYAGFSRRQQ